MMYPKYLHNKTAPGEIMTPDLKQLAMKALQDFRSGDLYLCEDHPFEVKFPNGYLAKVFREWVRNRCGDGTSLQAALELNKIFWSPSRIAEIETGTTNPTHDELLQWCDVNTDLCEGNAITTFPLNHDDKLLGWALIEHSGFALSPDIELIGIFTDMGELRKFVSDNFEG